MTAGELEGWLKTAESQSVGQKVGDEEATGRLSGRRIVEILRVNRSELSDDDVADTPWRYSLMNWGHDPLKKTWAQCA